MSSTQKQMIFGIVAGLATLFVVSKLKDRELSPGSFSQGLGITTMNVTDKDVV
jgi:hypothetical protein